MLEDRTGIYVSYFRQGLLQKPKRRGSRFTKEMAAAGQTDGGVTVDRLDSIALGIPPELRQTVV